MKTPEEIFDEALQDRGIDRIGLQDSEVYEAGLDAIKQVLTIPDVSNALPTDEEIKQKAFDFSYVFRDDEDCKRSDAVETYCEEMGHWIKNKIQGNEA